MSSIQARACYGDGLGASFSIRHTYRVNSQSIVTVQDSLYNCESYTLSTCNTHTHMHAQCEIPQVTRAAAINRSHYLKKGISHSSTLPSRMRSNKEGRTSVKDLFDIKEPAQKDQQRGSEETIVLTYQEPKDTSSYLSQYSSSTSLMDQESGYGSSGNQDNHQRYPFSQPLQSDPQVNGREKGTKFKVLSRNRLSSTTTAENKWKHKSRMTSTSDAPVTNTLSKAYQDEERPADSKRATSVTPVPRRKAPLAPINLTPSPTPKSPLCSPVVNRKQSATSDHVPNGSTSDHVPNGSPIFNHTGHNRIPVGSHVSPKAQQKVAVTRGRSYPATGQDTIIPYQRTVNPTPSTISKLGRRLSLTDHSILSSPEKHWAAVVHPISPGTDIVLALQNPHKQPEKATPNTSLTSPTHIRPRLDSYEKSTPSSSTQRRQRAWSRSSSEEEGHKHSGHGHRLSRHSFSENKTSPKTTSKRKDSGESRGRSGSVGHKSNKTANQILKQSGVNTVITSQRNKLLVSIRQGIQLRKVQKQEQQNSSQGTMPWDVAAILERRQIMEFSDNEHEEGAVDENEWEESG